MTTEVALVIDEERVEEIREPYVKALGNDWENIKTLYQTKRSTLFYALTPCEDTVFHCWSCDVKAAQEATNRKQAAQVAAK
ncbi:hypothetical protein SLA2020_239950 [Shorea laevis]